jgi:Protein of unknown function (DUF559)
MLVLAAGQHDLLTLEQLLDAGLSRDAIKHRIRTGRLHRIWPTVFTVGRPTLTREGEWLAAVLACGEGAALSHVSAAALWGIWEGARPRWPHVTVPTDSGRRGLPGIKLHRAPTLQATDITTRSAIPVTTLPRTLLDLTSVLKAKQLKSAVRQAERTHGLDLACLSTSLDALPPSSPPRAKLKRILEAYVPGTASTDGDPETEFLDLCAQHGIPLPTPQFEIGPYRADFAWPELNLVVEIDDRGSHDGYVAFQDDRIRDRAMKAAGFDVLRFTRNEVRRSPAAAAHELAAAIAAQRARTGSL